MSFLTNTAPEVSGIGHGSLGRSIGQASGSPVSERTVVTVTTNTVGTTGSGSSSGPGATNAGPASSAGTNTAK